MRPERMLSGCSCENKPNLRDLGRPSQDTVNVDNLYATVLHVSELDSLSAQTPNLFDGFQQMITALGIDTNAAKQTEIFQIDEKTIVGNKGYTAKEILQALLRFLRLAKNYQVISTVEQGKLLLMANTRPKISLGDFLDRIESLVESEKGKDLLQVRVDARLKKKEDFRKELQAYLGWNQQSQKYENPVNPRDVFEYFLSKYDLDNPRLGIEYASRVKELEIDGKVYDPTLLDALIGFAISYGSAIGALSTQEVKEWHHKLDQAATANKKPGDLFPRINNATKIEITRETLGLKQSTKIILGVGGLSVLGILGYHLLKTN